MNKKFLFLVPLLTLLTGFFSFLFLSFFYSVFYSKTVVDIPLVYNTSVMIGDAILLPIINYMIFKFMFRIGNIISQNKKLFIVSIIISLLISIAINLITHLAWKNDNITDFIAFEQGQFSIIGLWHLIFSITQTTVFFIFIMLWYLAIKFDSHLYAEIMRIWLFILLFTLLGIVDMVFKYFFIFSDKTFNEVLVLDKFAFVTPLTALGLFFLFRIFEKKKRKTTYNNV